MPTYCFDFFGTGPSHKGEGKEQGYPPSTTPRNCRTFLHLLFFTGKRSLHGHAKPLGLTLNLQKPFTAIHDPTLMHIHGHWMEEQGEGKPTALPAEQDL
jgi:hypothetical protein